MFRFTLLLSMLLPWSGYLAGQEKKVLVKEPMPTIKELISQLDSDDFKVRETATSILLKREGVRPVLRKALRDGQPPEARGRINNILTELDGRTAKLAQKRLPERLKNGRIDEIVEHLLLFPEAADNKNCDFLLDLARKLTAKVQKEHDENAFFVIRIDLFSAARNPKILKWNNKPSALESEKDKRLNATLIIGEGPIKPKINDLDCNILFLNGDFEYSGILSSCILVCDGNVKLAGNPSRCLIIARGTLTCPRKDRFVFDEVQDFLGLIKFFDIRQAGVEVAADNEKILVKEVIPSSPFGRAGVLKGDRLIALDNMPLTNKTTLRRLLRRYTVANDEVFLTVYREGQGLIPLTLNFE